MQETEKRYTSKEIAKRINIEPVTLRKYSIELEKRGMEFEKNENNWRLYSDIDLSYFRYLARLRDDGVSLEDAMTTVIDLYKSNLNIMPKKIEENDITIPDMRALELQKVAEFMEEQRLFNQQILEKMTKAELRAQERDQLLLTAMKESLETRKQIAAAIEKKKWWQFWL